MKDTLSSRCTPTTLVTRVGKKSFYTHFAPAHPDAMLTKHFHLTQVCILPFSNIGRGNGGVDTYSVDITIIISCFWHFPTQFVQDCRYLTRSLRSSKELVPSSLSILIFTAKSFFLGDLTIMKFFLEKMSDGWSIFYNFIVYMNQNKFTSLQ